MDGTKGDELAKVVNEIGNPFIKDIRTVIFNFPKLIPKTLGFIFFTFIGLIINIIIGYAFISEKIAFCEFVTSSNIIFALLSTIIGVSMSGIVYYYNLKQKNRGLIIIILLVLLLITVAFSIIAYWRANHAHETETFLCIR